MMNTILVVDDEKNIRRTVFMVLEGAGYAVHTAPTAEHGIDLLAQEEIDLLILDVRLPGMSGLDLLEQIRKRGKSTPQIPVIVISGHASLEEAVEAGFEPEFVEQVSGLVRNSHFKRVPPLVAKLSTRSIGHDFLYLRDWGR